MGAMEVSQPIMNEAQGKEARMLERHQAVCNERFWTRGDCVAFYATRGLRAAESVLLERHRSALSGRRVLELGCGAGRLTGHLSDVAGEVHGVDLSPAMIAYCRRTYPRCSFQVRDLRDLSGFHEGSYGAVFAPYNVLDALGEADRRGVLAQVRGLLAPGGLLVLSAHNRTHKPLLGSRVRLLVGSPRRPLQSLRRLPLRLRNRRRLAPLQRSTPGYAIRNDEAHDFALLHYYVTRDAQERQLAEHGFELLECLDLRGRSVARGASARRCPELHYVARRYS